jgi:phosphohistidine phosphatase
LNKKKSNRKIHSTNSPSLIDVSLDKQSTQLKLASSSSSSSLSHIPDVEISEGIFKYVLIEVTLEGSSKIIVRGEDKEYHKGVKQSAERRLVLDLRNKGIKTTCPGGGRIRHLVDSKSILVYGFSNAYGQGDHSYACELIKQAYPHYPSEQITWSNEGY